MVEKNLNLVQLAELIDYDSGNLSKIINGKLGISKQLAFKIKDKLGVDISPSARPKRYRKTRYEIIDESTDNILRENAPTAATFQSEQSKPNPRMEARPLHRASDPNDYENDGSKFEDLGDGIIRMRVPIVPFKSYAGYLRGYQDPEFYEGLQTVSVDVYKEYRGHYLAFEVEGDSMTTTDPDLFQYMALPGWKAVGRELPRHHWQYKLHTHRTDTWIIVHKTEGILIKNISEHDVDNAKITIHSLNPKYPDEVLELNDITQIFSVVKYIVDK